MSRQIGISINCATFNSEDKVKIRAPMVADLVKLHPCDVALFGGGGGVNAIEELSYSPFQTFVNQNTGVVQAIGGVLKDSSDVHSVEYFDGDGNNLGSLPAQSVRFTNYKFDLVTKKCWCDDNGGSITPYYRVYGHQFRGTSPQIVRTHALGTYTDESLQTVYTVLGTEAECDEIGALGELKVNVLEAVGAAGTIVIADNAGIQEIIIQVIAAGTSSSITFNGNNGSRSMQAGERIHFTNFSLENDGFDIANSNALDNVVVTYTTFI